MISFDIAQETTCSRAETTKLHRLFYGATLVKSCDLLPCANHMLHSHHISNRQERDETWSGCFLFLYSG